MPYHNSGVMTAYGEPEVIGGDDNSGDDQQLMQKVLEWEQQAKEAQSENRLEMAIDADFADDKQISDEDMAILIKRKQPPVQMNLIKPAVEWIVGTEKRTRMDARAYPRQDSEEANDAATNKTKLIKYNNDVNKSAYARSKAFRSGVTVGLGWLEDGIRNDDTGELSYSRSESWRNVWYDHLGVENDLSDSRFLFRQKWIDLDITQAMFPHKKAVLRSCATHHGNLRDFDDSFLPQVYRKYDTQGYRVGYQTSSTTASGTSNRRERCRMMECWYREPRLVKKIRDYSSDLNGSVFDPENERHAQAAQEQVVSLYDAMEMVMRCVIYCEEYLLEDMDTPYKHNDFPFTPVWGYRRDRDNAPYGVVRNMRDAQRDHNARLSKALHIISSRQIVANTNAAEDWDAIRDAAAAPDGIMLIKGNADTRFELLKNNDVAEEHIMLMKNDADYMTRSSGVTDENLGQDSSAISGKAILAKQNEGSVVTFTLFDNLRFAVQLQGEKQLSNIEQFYDMPKQIRIIGDNSKHEFTSINMPEWDPLSGQMVIKNDITASQADFIVDTSDFRQSVRQAQFEAMMDIISRMDSEVSLQVLDLAIDMSDISNKEEWVRRIRSLNGQRDSEDKLSPEEEQELAAQEQEQQRQQQLVEAEQMAKTEQMTASADKAKADTALVKISTVEKAAETAALMLTMPAVSLVSDAVLESAGYEDMTDIGAIDVPREAPTPDPEAVAQATEHKNPEPKLDPNQVYSTDARAKTDEMKIKAASSKQTAKKKPAAKKKASAKKKPKPRK